MSNIIDSIKLSGTVYTLSAQTSGGGGNPTVELTQAEYDALVSAGTVSADTYYIITDAQAGDLTQYWTSAQTQSAITEAVSGKASASDVDTLSGTVTGMNSTLTAHTADTTIHVTSNDKNTWSGKQDALVSGTNIKTINNESILGSGNITIQGGGGGMSADMEQLIATSLVDLNDRKIDASEVNANYQKKGDYATKSEVALKANASDVMTLEKATQNELITASALNNLNNKFGGLKLVKITESEYAALSTKDENTLYIVVADPS